MNELDKWSAELKEKLSYNQDTGVFTWISNSTRSGNRIGCRAGTLSKQHGYRTIQVGKIRYLEHRLAFYFMTGIIPTQIDHINRVRDDNRWSNLRLCTPRENCENSVANSAFIGVWFRSDRRRWIVSNSSEKNQRRKRIGSFKTHLCASYCKWAYELACAQAIMEASE